MKLIKLQPDHYIIVDDSEINEGDWVFNEKSKEIYPITIIEEVVYYEKKITHSTEPLEDYARADGKTIKVYVQVKSFHLYEVKELLVEVDVEKKAEEYGKSIGTKDGTASFDYKRGYNQCLEDNKEKKYTKEDLLDAFTWGFVEGTERGDVTDSVNKFSESLQPQN